LDQGRREKKKGKKDEGKSKQTRDRDEWIEIIETFEAALRFICNAL
jgi:hypothetical protein